MRVLFLASYFPKPTNPLIGTWALSQARALERQGFSVRVVSPTSWVPRIAARSRGARAFADCPYRYDWGTLRVDYPRWLLYQVEHARTWFRRWPRLQMQVAWLTVRSFLRRSVRDFQPDVVYAHHAAVSGYVAERLHRTSGVPFVLTDHDFDEITDCEYFPDRRRLYDRVLAGAFAIIAVSHRMESDLRRLFPHARVETLHNGTDPISPALFVVPRPEPLRGRRIVFSAAMFYERKGVPLLVEAFGRIASRHPDAVLRIAGDGPKRSDVEAAVRRTGLGSRVALLGALPHERVLQELVWSDVFALVGWNEPFGVVYGEAAAAGKPIVLTSDGGFMDVFRDRVHGLAVPPRDPSATAAALDWLLANPASAADMGAAARALWEGGLTWDSNARRLGEVLTAAARARPPRPGATAGPRS